MNVFKAILSIERFFNLTEYRGVIVKNSLLVRDAQTFSSLLQSLGGAHLTVVSLSNLL